jgi:regulator of cell morphogenesis and NO signaling
MDKEEKVLFPYITNLETPQSRSAFPPFGKIETPISVLIREHEEAGGEIETIKQITNNFTPPENACTTFRITFHELEEFYKDLKIHIHLENNILFPKAIELESSERINN